MTHAPVTWAVMGTGMIARKVLPLLRAADNCNVICAASRDAGRANAFAEEFDLPGGGCIYDELLSRDDVQAVYLTLPNHLHVPWSIRLLEAGMHVLCEKPLTPFVHEARTIFEVAQRTDRHCVEGFMYMHHPQTARLIEIARAGETPGSIIGALTSIDVGSCLDLMDRVNIESRLSHRMQGGAIMDLGCYPIGLARLLIGEEPDEIFAEGRLDDPIPGESLGVDVQAEIEMTFPSGVVVDASCSIDEQQGVWLEMLGTWGRIWTDLPFRPDPSRAILEFERFDNHPDGPGDDRLVIEDGGDRFTNQFADFAMLIRGEPVQRPHPTPEWSIGQARTIEEVLRQVGVCFSELQPAGSRG